MNNKTAISKSKASRKTGSFNIRKEDKDGLTYYVTRSEDGEVKERTRVLVPARSNRFFRKAKPEPAA